MNYAGLRPVECALALLVLAVGVALMVVAQRRNWHPSLALALYTALVLRLVMLGLTYHLQPYDLANDFQSAAYAVLHHRDPILNTRPHGWSSLPVYAFPLAGALWTSLHLHISWLIMARIPAILCDLGVVVLVGAIAEAVGERKALRRFQYACNPITILVSSLHGQLEPACLLFAFGAFAVVLRAGPQISSRRAVVGGVLLGLGIATQSWPILFAPALLFGLPSWRRRVEFTAGAAGLGALLFLTLPLTVGTPVGKLPQLAKTIMSNHPTIGTWGWSGLWMSVHHTKLPVWADPLWIHVASYGTRAAMLATLIMVWLWRRAHPLDIATATSTALVAFTPAFGNQYLMWQAPSATARPSRLMLPVQIAIGLYAAIFYLPMDMLGPTYWNMANDLMMIVSIALILFMLFALPWGRRKERASREQPAPTEPAPDVLTA